MLRESAYPSGDRCEIGSWGGESRLLWDLQGLAYVRVMRALLLIATGDLGSYSGVSLLSGSTSNLLRHVGDSEMSRPGGFRWSIHVRTFPFIFQYIL